MSGLSLGEPISIVFSIFFLLLYLIKFMRPVRIIWLNIFSILFLTWMFILFNKSQYYSTMRDSMAGKYSLINDDNLKDNSRLEIELTSDGSYRLNKKSNHFCNTHGK